MPIVHPPPICSKILFLPLFYMPETRFLRQKSAEKMKKRHFQPQKPLKTAPTAPISKICLTHKLITTNHPICHTPRLKNYFSAIFVSTTRKTPLKAPQTDPSRPPNRPLLTLKPTPSDPQTDPSRPPNRPLRDSQQHPSNPQQGSFFRPFEPHKSIESLPPQMAHRQQSERHVKYI